MKSINIKNEKPAARAHRWAKEMVGLAGDELAEKYAWYMTRLVADGEEIACRTVKTWLLTYKLPINPELSRKFTNGHEQFRFLYGKAIVESTNSAVQKYSVYPEGK